MGFGTLFIGVFLLLNLRFFGYTDILSGVIMLAAFYKLRVVNNSFRAAMFASIAFCGIGLIEFVREAAYLFSGYNLDSITVYFQPLRYLAIGACMLMLHYGIRNVSKEVDLPKTAKRARVCEIMAYPVFSLCSIERTLALFLEESAALLIFQIITLLALLVLLVITLINIYSAYMYICMPAEQNNEYFEKPSRFEFVNRFRKRQEEKNREYAEYRIGRIKNRIERKNKRKKKK